MCERIKQGLFLFLVLLVVGSEVQATEPTVISFDDLDYDTTLSGTTYAGLTWEWGNQGAGGNSGQWGIPPEGYNSYPYSAPHYVVNGYGASLMGISFPGTVNVLGAYFAGAGSSGDWSPMVKVHGYLHGSEIVTTDWFNDIDATPSWFAMNLNSVDRIVIEAIPFHKPGVGDVSLYGMDDFTYVVPEPATIALLVFGGLMLRRNRKVF